MGYDAVMYGKSGSQTFTSKNHNLGHEWDRNVKLALISITLAAQIS